MPDGSLILSTGGLIAIFGLIYKVSHDSSCKIKRVYDRIDEIKNKNDIDYTRKDVCEVRHQQISSDLAEIKKDVKTLLKNGGH